ncbi:MAG: hypothetical protein AAGK23_00070 [Pseudomonadota bacterium]
MAIVDAFEPKPRPTWLAVTKPPKATIAPRAMTPQAKNSKVL